MPTHIQGNIKWTSICCPSFSFPDVIHVIKKNEETITGICEDSFYGWTENYRQWQVPISFLFINCMSNLRYMPQTSP